MNKTDLQQYRSRKEEISELEERLKNLNEEMLDHDIIMDYKKGYPRPQAVIGVNERRMLRMEKTYKERIASLEKECETTESEIENISDSITRRILRMHYIEGMTLKEISEQVHIDKSNISRKIQKTLKSQPTQQKP